MRITCSGRNYAWHLHCSGRNNSSYGCGTCTAVDVIIAVMDMALALSGRNNGSYGCGTCTAVDVTIRGTPTAVDVTMRGTSISRWTCN